MRGWTDTPVFREQPFQRYGLAVKRAVFERDIQFLLFAWVHDGAAGVFNVQITEARRQMQFSARIFLEKFFRFLSIEQGFFQVVSDHGGVIGKPQDGRIQVIDILFGGTDPFGQIEKRFRSVKFPTVYRHGFDAVADRFDPFFRDAGTAIDDAQHGAASCAGAVGVVAAVDGDADRFTEIAASPQEADDGEATLAGACNQPRSALSWTRCSRAVCQS